MKNTFRFDGKTSCSARETPSLVAPFYTDEADRARQFDLLSGWMDQARNRMHAHEKYGLVVLFQAMDAGGKDSSIRLIAR